jgi:hypothetical protein
MKTHFCRTLALVGLSLAAGCYINLGDSCRRPRESVPPLLEPAAEVMPPDAVIEEIEAVRRLGIESDRHTLFHGIAERQHLSPAGQVHLVKAASESLAIETDRVDVLLTLARNPGLSEEGVRALVRRVDSLGIESDRRELLEAIGKRQSQPPVPPVPGPGPDREPRP